MKDRFTSAFALATVAGAIVSASAMIGSNAYAEGPIIDSTPFVSKRTVSDVRAELKAGQSTLSPSEWDLQGNGMLNVASSYTRAEATSAFLAAREESSALVSEDSGSGYIAKQHFNRGRDSMMAGGLR